MEKKIQEIMSLQISGENFKGLQPIREFIVETPGKVMGIAATYLDNPNERARYLAVQIIHEAGQTSRGKTRQEAVNQLVIACRDNQQSIRSLASTYLESYQRVDFTPEVKDTIKSLLQVPEYGKNLLLIAGYVQPNGVASTLKEIEEGRIYKHTDRWNLYLALARCGEQEYIDYIVTRVQTLGLNDEVVTSLYPGLAYTRQARAIEVLTDVIHQDEKACLSPNPESGESIPCGYRVMEILAPVIKGFPLQLNPSGELKTKDYQQAYKRARKWLKDNERKIRIIEDQF
jgi:hypothetical protein